MNVLVTGGAGFIGSNLASRLERELQIKLILVDNFSRGKQEYLDYLGVKTHCIELDLLDYDAASVITKNMDVVYHTACRIGGMQFLHGSPEAELRALQENMTIDTNVFRACIENNVKKIIYTSSISVYNTEKQMGKWATFKESDVEHDKFSPEGGYGLSKYVAEKELSYMSKIGIQTGIARIFKSYGPCDDYSEQSGQVVCSLFRKALTQDGLVVWGSGGAKRCLLYIDDLIDGLIRLANWDGSLTVNLGASRPTKIKELAELVVQTTGKQIPIKYDITKPEGPLSRIPDLTRAKETLDWEPTTPLEDGLAKTYAFMKQEYLKGRLNVT
jgi:nucleoside-diphosphate-sugar epimerase